jgi:hypothetical protein
MREKCYARAGRHSAMRKVFRHMSGSRPPFLGGPPRYLADLTQSWSEVGGGVGTYLRHKRRHILRIRRTGTC